MIIGVGIGTLFTVFAAGLLVGGFVMARILRK